MIPDRDYYADKHGQLTDDPDQYARQIGVKGFELDERVARRYGISDTLVSTGEPHAVRRVTGRSAASVRITKAEETTEAKPAETKEPQEPAEAAESKAEEPTEEPKAEEAKTEAVKPTAKEGEKKK